jgi:photosystem II stability/assembly factor-like uncharacterized protein
MKWRGSGRPEAACHGQPALLVRRGNWPFVPTLELSRPYAQQKRSLEGTSMTTAKEREEPSVRHKRHLLAFALVAGALLTPPLHAGWRSVGPYGGTVTVVAVDPTRPSTILAGTNQGLFRSDDRGASWEFTAGDIFSTVGPIAFDRLHPGRVYVAINASVLSSRDHGRTWHSVPLPSDDEDVTVTALVVGPNGNVYASAGALFRSADRGRTWVSLGAAVPAQSFSTFLAFDFTSAALYSVSAQLDGGGVYRSRDGGVTFKPIGLQGVSLSFVAVAPGPTNVLYAGGSPQFAGGQGGLFRSTDGGAHWREIDAGLPSQFVTSVAVHPTKPATLYAGLQADPDVDVSSGGLFESVDGGSHWVARRTGLPADDVLSVALDPTFPSHVYSGLGNDGVFRSADAGGHWSWANTGLALSTIDNLVIDPERPDTVYARTLDKGLYKSTNAGRSWQLVNDRVAGGTSFAVSSVLLDPRHTATVYASVEGRVERSDDGGQSWRRLDNGERRKFGGPLALDPHDPSTLYVGGVVGVSKSTDGGDTWSDPVAPQPLATPFLLAVSPLPPYTVYLSAVDATELFESTDAGASWVPIGPFFRQLVPDPASANVLYGLDYFWHLLKSTDGGLSFAGTPAGDLLFGTLVRDPVTPSRLYAVLLSEGKIIASDDDFATSQQIGADIIGQPFALAIDPDVPGRLWAGSQYGVFVFDP